MIGAVNAEVFNPIAQRLKRGSPYKATMMATLTNGSARSGYIRDDASFEKQTFEVLSSRVQPGCAEASIVNSILELSGTLLLHSAGPLRLRASLARAAAARARR